MSKLHRILGDIAVYTGNCCLPRILFFSSFFFVPPAFPLFLLMKIYYQHLTHQKVLEALRAGLNFFSVRHDVWPCSVKLSWEHTHSYVLLFAQIGLHGPYADSG